MSDIDYEWFLDFGNGYVTYHGNNVKSFAKKVSKAHNCQVDIYRLEFTEIVSSPAGKQGVGKQLRTTEQSVAEAAQIKPCGRCKFEPECRFKNLCESHCNFFITV
jgi:hypothetical protein